MRKRSLVLFLLLFSMVAIAGCSGEKTEDPGEPPKEAIQSENDADASADNASADGENTPADSSLKKAAVTAKIGRSGGEAYDIDMYGNAAVDTMLGYLSGDEMMFPTYTYEEDAGFVAQDIQGSYTNQDETEIKDIKKGELYLLDGGQLRLYFKDVKDANIKATPVGYFADASQIEKLVTDAHDENKDDSWGVEVYFRLTKK